MISTTPEPGTAGRPPLLAVFLDRDGVLIEDKHYQSDPDSIAWIDGAQMLIGQLANRGILRFIVTNQSGVARGFFDLAAVDSIHARMAADLGPGPGFTDIGICPHLPEGNVKQFAIPCDCRKPAPGMLTTLLARYRLAPENCCMVGDKDSDVAAARAAGMAGFRFDGGNLSEWFARTVTQSGMFADA